MGSHDFQRQLQGYSLATARILYHLPDYPGILQAYIWQDYDVAPEFPNLNQFLKFWHTKLEGPLHSVQLAHAKLLGPVDLVTVDGLWSIN